MALGVVFTETSAFPRPWIASGQDLAGMLLHNSSHHQYFGSTFDLLPLDNIRNTRTIKSVYVAGNRVD